MPRAVALSTRVSPKIKRALQETCRRSGLKVTAVVEQALREKLEDLADNHDLEDAVRSAEEMIPYRRTRAALRRDGVL